MPTEKKKCYSYIRWSSDRQASGTTLERQLDIAREIAGKNNLELVEIFDKGVSAFKGVNRNKGELGAFIEAVDAKLIPSDSWLVVENLDRLSRQEITESHDLFMNLIRKGLTIVTGIDGRKYNREIINQNPTELMFPIMVLTRANEESETKSVRTYKSALKVIERYNAGERSPEGYAYAINSVGSNMWWVDCSKPSENEPAVVKPHPKLFEVAKKIIELALDGWGMYRVKEYLNENHSAPQPKSKQDKGIKAKWTTNRLSKFYKSRALIGEKVINIGDDEYKIPDYYPPLIDEDTFYRLREIKSHRNVKPSHTDKVYLFTGRNIIKCGHCGAKMINHTSNDRKKYRYICADGRNYDGGCRPWSFKGVWLDDTVIRLAANHVFRPHDETESMQNVVNGLKKMVEDKEDEIGNILDLVASGVKTKSIPERIARLEQEIDKARQDLEIARKHQSMQLTETVEWGEVNADVLDIESEELRREIKKKIQLSVKEIVCVQVQPRLMKFIITFVNGVTITALRTPMTLAFDGKAWDELGDFYRKPVHISKAEQFKHSIDELAKKFGDTSRPETIPLNDPDVMSIIDSIYIGEERTKLKKAKLLELGKSELSFEEEFELKQVPIAPANQRQLQLIYDEVFALPESNIGNNDTYMYNGFRHVAPEMMERHEQGEEPKELEHDLTRINHLVTWGEGKKGVPKIIEDQFAVYKHKYKKHLINKPDTKYYYIKEERR